MAAIIIDYNPATPTLLSLPNFHWIFLQTYTKKFKKARKDVYYVSLF